MAAGRGQFRLLPRGRLDEPYRGRRPCAICGHRGEHLRRINFRSRPWGQLAVRLRFGTVIHTWHAIVPDEPIYREIPVTWGKSPVEFARRIQALAREGNARARRAQARARARARENAARTGGKKKAS